LLWGIEPAATPVTTGSRVFWKSGDLKSVGTTRSFTHRLQGKCKKTIAG